MDFCNYARREYYLRPAYIWAKLRTILFHPEELRRTVKAFFTFYKYLFNKDNKKNKAKFASKISVVTSAKNETEKKKKTGD